MVVMCGVYVCVFVRECESVCVCVWCICEIMNLFET